MTSGPLAGLRVVEMAAIGPVPHAAMMLADLGADVVTLDRTSAVAEPDGVADPNHVVRRSRLVVRLDLRSPEGLAEAHRLISGADVLLEGFRPGVMERLGLGPDDLLALNSRLVYTRVTGWGQDGPWARRAGHDLNYLAATGLLGAIGPADGPPVPPLTLVANHGGGSMMALTGLLSALFERERSGRGQVVDVSMAEGAATLGAMVWSWRSAGRWSDERGDNLIDGAAPFYDCYACADGRFVALAPLEPAFFAEAVQLLGLDPQALPDQYDAAGWPRWRSAIAARFLEHGAEEWVRVFDGSDGCLSLVEGLGSASSHPQLAARHAFVELDGITQPAPSPRFDRTPSGPVRRSAETSVPAVVDRWAASAGAPSPS